VQNYGSTARTVTVYWERFTYYDMSGGTAVRTATPGYHSLSVPANSTRTYWLAAEYNGSESGCNGNEGCHYVGAKGHLEYVGYNSVSSYSPLQSPFTGCVDGPSPVTNWAHTGWCED
jgi:hypothetical protein